MASTEVQVIEWAADLTKGFGANVGVHYDRLSVTGTVVLLLLWPSRV